MMTAIVSFFLRLKRQNARCRHENEAAIGHFCWAKRSLCTSSLCNCYANVMRVCFLLWKQGKHDDVSILGMVTCKYEVAKNTHWSSLSHPLSRSSCENNKDIRHFIVNFFLYFPYTRVSQKSCYCDVRTSASHESRGKTLPLAHKKRDKMSKPETHPPNWWAAVQ
jgi:hypothetical protein